MPDTLCTPCSRDHGRHDCAAPDACRCTGPHFANAADTMPAYLGAGCTWHAGDPTRCFVHDSPLVLVPITHSAPQQAPVRMCRVLLAEAAAAPVPRPRPTIVDQLAQRMDTGVYVNNRGWGTASHVEAARRTLAALPALNDETVDSLAAVTLFADHPLHPGEGNWDTVPPYARERWRTRIRALLDALAKAAD